MSGCWLNEIQEQSRAVRDVTRDVVNDLMNERGNTMTRTTHSTASERCRWMCKYVCGLFLVAFTCAGLFWFGAGYGDESDWPVVIRETALIPNSMLRIFLEMNNGDLNLALVSIFSVLMTLSFIFTASFGRGKKIFVTSYFTVNLVAYCVFLTLAEKYHG
jgi:hypothetical protein